MYRTNLWRAVLQLFKSRDPVHLIINTDRLLNAVAAGHYRATISARVGWFELIKNNPYWDLLGTVIDATFRPIDGENHCYKAYLWEKDQNKAAGRSKYNYRRGNDIALAVLGLFVIAGCFVLAPIIYLISFAR